MVEADAAGRLQRAATMAFQLFQEPGQAETIQSVFETGPVAILTITEVALDAHHQFGEGGGLVRLDKTDFLRQTGIAVLAVVQLAHAATDTDVEADQIAVVHHRDIAQILAVDVDVVDWRQHEADLEFAWQVQLAIDRLLAVAHRRRLLMPDVRIGAGFRNQTVTGDPRQLLHPLVSFGQVRIGAAHHAAVVVAAGGDGVQL